MASIIDRKLAKSLINEYRVQNASPAGPAIKTTDGQHLHGFFIDRKSLETILSNPAFDGVSIHFAKHPDHAGSPENTFTIMFSGAEPNPLCIEGSIGVAPYINTCDIYDFTIPCPPNCATII